MVKYSFSRPPIALHTTKVNASTLDGFKYEIDLGVNFNASRVIVINITPDHNRKLNSNPLIP
jgi:hypothetical protein